MRLLWAGTIRDRLRLWSGLVLFAFALTHVLNHALGLVSLDAMDLAQSWRLAVTRSGPGSAVLILALLTHAALALWKLAQVRTIRLRKAEIFQGLTGFAIPLLLTRHMFLGGVAPRVLHIHVGYPDMLAAIWPSEMVWQSILLLVVWTHGCLGLHYWLRGEIWWRRASHVLAALATLVPLVALLGVVAAGREEAARLADPALAHGATTALTATLRAALAARARDVTRLSYVLIAAVAAVPILRLWLLRRPTRLAVTYAEGLTAPFAIGPTLLEISRASRVPHLSVCGGKARCSTCRVRIVAGGETLDPPGEAERRLLRRIGAPADVRLACQIRPNRSIAVTRLLKPEAHVVAPPPASGLEAAGVDREAAVLFVDIRGFTRLSQAKLAYDVVYILNSFFAGIGRSIEAAGGRVDKYIGDGVMAVFEHPEGLGGATRAAIRAVLAIDGELEDINHRLAEEIAEPLRLAMGLHGGRLVSGRIGWGAAALPTVIGPAVNVASRLESLAKANDVELALSRECAIAAGLPIEALVVDDVEIRGIEGPFPVVLARRIADLDAAKAV
jgi:adenylate cyclase